MARKQRCGEVKWLPRVIAELVAELGLRPRSPESTFRVVVSTHLEKCSRREESGGIYVPFSRACYLQQEVWLQSGWLVLPAESENALHPWSAFLPFKALGHP